MLYGGDNYAMESQDYFVLSRVALTLDSPMMNTTVTAVQTIVSGFTHRYLQFSKQYRFTWPSTCC
jgi:hypothetical protein